MYWIIPIQHTPNTPEPIFMANSYVPPPPPPDDDDEERDEERDEEGYDDDDEDEEESSHQEGTSQAQYEPSIIQLLLRLHSLGVSGT